MAGVHRDKTCRNCSYLSKTCTFWFLSKKSNTKYIEIRVFSCCEWRNCWKRKTCRLCMYLFIFIFVNVEKNIYPDSSIISLHIRSMWETICDALASWSGWKCGWKYPSPSPENWNLGIPWHFMTFQFWPVENTPPPKLKFRHFLAFYDLSILTCGEYPPSPPKIEI